MMRLVVVLLLVALTEGEMVGRCRTLHVHANLPKRCGYSLEAPVHG
jgi:hypothetical protein